MNETWKDIPNYVGIYQASNKGNIRTHVNKTSIDSRGRVKRWKQRMLKQCFSQNGYHVVLWKDGTKKSWLVARLVCATFYENMLETKMTVNHKDGDKRNNNIKNLEWMTLGDNIRHAFDNNLIKSQKPIMLKNKYTGEKTYHRSKEAATKYMGKCHSYIYSYENRGKNENKNYKWQQITWEQYLKGKKK